MNTRICGLIVPMAIGLISGATLSACGDDEPADPSDLTWHQSVAPVVVENCVGCHTEGGAGPFALDTPEQWRIYGAVAIDAIESERMPPWQPDPGCRDFDDERIMDVADRELVRRWIDAGMVVGDAASAAPIVAPELPTFDPTINANIGVSYTPTLGMSDDYRCFILDMDFESDVYMTGSHVVPGNSLVHHVLVYALEGDAAQEAITLDDEFDGPGYTCFGGPIPFGGEDESDTPQTPQEIAARLSAFGGFPNQIGAWVPGQNPNLAPDGMATRISAGSRVVMQVHYSAVAGSAVADSETELQLQVTSERPELLRRSRPVAIQELDIPAGEPDAVHEQLFRYYGETALQIRGFVAHMHMLGTEQRLDIVRVDGSEECGLYVPDWDFNWQQGYTIAGGATVDLVQGDGVRLMCAYNNAVENQPIVNGELQEPRDVTWGDGTLDEMCLQYIDTVEPYSDPLGTACDPGCAARCEAGDTACQVSCAAGDMACLGCVLEGTIDCGATQCMFGVLADRECLRTCGSSSIMLGSNLAACMRAECPDILDGLETCMGPVLQEEACMPAVTACGM